MPPPPPGPQFSSSTVLEDVKAILKQIGVEFKEVRRCSANIEDMKTYVYYLHPYEKANVTSVIESFIESECRPRKVKSLYIWITRDQTYSYLNIGFFSEAENKVTALTYLSVITVR